MTAKPEPLIACRHAPSTQLPAHGIAALRCAKCGRPTAAGSEAGAQRLPPLGAQPRNTLRITAASATNSDYFGTTAPT